MIGIDAARAAISPYLLLIKIGLLAALLSGAALWHVHAVSDAHRAGKAEAEAVCAESARVAKLDADKRLSDQRATADKALADYATAQANFEKQIKGRQDALRKATANLAQCRLSADAVRLLNDSRASAAGSDRPAVPDSGAAVPNP